MLAKCHAIAVSDICNLLLLTLTSLVFLTFPSQTILVLLSRSEPTIPLGPQACSHGTRLHRTPFHPPATSLLSYQANGHPRIAGCMYRLASFVVTREGPSGRSYHRWKWGHRSSDQTTKVGSA